MANVPEELIQSLNLKLTKRPDIFLYASEEKCLLVELKEPNEDLSDHLNQLTKYCNLIANYSVQKISSFHCCLIGENINPITDLDGDY
ncbi:type I restriction enzyme HsdR N-terminal domain-containing protein [Desulfuromusa kysingii]|uniref:type I restriction enzyme HsdR N-terminal domain-containing protein n=1 Tax=Desulfuromusa kysingii TaxID=37625 RepID=UPI0015875435|nr:type I restriction enzyme HsdR N-terminal domain-containing protein [Desulfuromusa kysingii]